jgi:hypothetical protein
VIIDFDQQISNDDWTLRSRCGELAHKAAKCSKAICGEQYVIR